MPSVLILDAMGVIFQAADDVGELLIPFIAENGGVSDAAMIEAIYTRASLGEIAPEQLWDAVKISAALEDTYLARHRLTPGLADFLNALPSGIDSLWCLSNDVSAWSRKLRHQFSLADHFAGFVISGDVGCRKPDRHIYEKLLAQIGRPASECIFVDDRLKNLDAAASLGIRTVWFSSADGNSNTAHKRVGSFDELANYLSNLN